MIVHADDACLCATPLCSGRAYMKYGKQCRLCSGIIVSERRRNQLLREAEERREAEFRRHRKQAQGGLPPEGPARSELRGGRISLNEWFNGKRGR